MRERTQLRLYRATAAVLALVVAAMTYKFIVVGSTRMGEDARIAVILEAGERTLVLREMRDFVAGLQQIADALARDDMPGVAQAARGLGGAKSHDVPAALLGKLPLEFKTLAFGTHGGFDAIAADAQANGTPKHTLAQLAEVLQKCVACHVKYEIQAAATK